MPNNDSHQHVVKSSAQWNERAIEFWVVPRGCLCVELTPKGKTKIKVGEGNKFYSQLPYITDEVDLNNYYTKTEVDNIIQNLNLMAIRSTDEYDSKNDLPPTGNKLGDVRFVKSQSPSIKTDPDIYLWNGRKWIFVGYDIIDIDLSSYLKKTEFHELFDPVKEKVDEMYPKMHTHNNKDILDRIEEPYTTAEKNKLADLENYDDRPITHRVESLESVAHTHHNLDVLEHIEEPYTTAEKNKLASLENYDDGPITRRVEAVEADAHHDNRDILDQVTAPFTVEDKTKLDSLHNNEVFIGTDGMYPGSDGLVPGPSTADAGKFLCADGTWKEAGGGTVVYDFVGATADTDGEHGLVPAPLAGQQSYYLKGDGTWAKVKAGGKYKSGDGIYILSGEATSDTFPFNIYSQASRVKQYIIYGNAGGVGDLVNGEYHIPIKVSAAGHADRISTIIISEPMYVGDYIDFEKQVFAHYRTDISSQVQNESTDTRETGISSTGNLYYKRSYSGWGGSPRVTDYYEIDPTASYEISQVHPDNDFSDSLNVNIYDANKNRTRTIVTSTTAVTTFTPISGEVYIRQSYTGIGDGYCHIFKLQPVETPCILQEVILYPNAINTIDVVTTNKPAEVYFEVDEPDDSDPDDPMSEYTGIIYNDGVLDITQEDPTALNELTVHFRESSKVLTIPDNQYTLPPATTSTLGGVIVGDGLEVDQDGVLDTVPYEAGVGLTLGTPITHNANTDIPETYLQLEYLESTGTQCIKFDGLAIDNYVNVTVDFMITSIVDDTWIAGSGNSWYGYYRGLGMINGVLRKEDANTVYDPDTLQEGLRVVGTFYVDESYQYVYAFARSGSNGSVYGNAYCRIYEITTVEMSSSSEVRPGGRQCHFFPCVRKSDGIPGLYDTVYGTFFTNSGTGDLICGPENTVTEYIDGMTFNVNVGDGLEVDNNNNINVKIGDGLYFDANGAVAASGGGGTTYQAGEGINITSDTIPAIEAKLGEGLHFDTNDAIAADKYLAGQGIEIGYHEGIVVTNPEYYFDTQVTCALRGSFYRKFTKTTNEPALGALINCRNSGQSDSWTGPIFVGPTASSVKCSYNTDNVVGPFTYKGRTWFSTGTNYWVDGSLTDLNNHLPRIPGQEQSVVPDDIIDFTVAKMIIDAAGFVESNNQDISAKLGEGLHFDSNDAIEVDSMIGATSQANGESGTVPQPLIGDRDKFLRGDGTWAEVSGGGGGPYVTSVTNTPNVPGSITIDKSDGSSSDVDVLENMRLILNCNFEESENQNSGLGSPVNAPGSGTQMNTSIMGDLTVLEV